MNHTIKANAGPNTQGIFISAKVTFSHEATLTMCSMSVYCRIAVFHHHCQDPLARWQTRCFWKGEVFDSVNTAVTDSANRRFRAIACTFNCIFFHSLVRRMLVLAFETVLTSVQFDERDGRSMFLSPVFDARQIPFRRYWCEITQKYTFEPK